MRLPPRLALAGLAAIASLIAAASASPSEQAVPYPNSIAAIGDSWTTPYCTRSDCTVHAADSWSTGSNPKVDSHYLRILAANPAIRGHNYNIADHADTLGPGIADLAYQAKLAIATRADYVTIALGENNLCDGTTPAAFRADFTTGMNKLTRGLPTASIFVASISDLTDQWRALHANPKIAPTVFLDCGLGPGATATQLAAVRSRIVILNRQLVEGCAKYAHCRYDGGAVFRIAWTANDFASRDLGHLTIHGQHKLAAATWNSTYHFSH